MSILNDHGCYVIDIKCPNFRFRTTFPTGEESNSYH